MLITALWPFTVNKADASQVLVNAARLTMANHFAQHPKTLSQLVKAIAASEADIFEKNPAYKEQKGLFVTLSKGGKTRACWGSINPTEANLLRATVYTTEGALTKEYRFPPIKPEEITSLKVQITVIDRVEPVSKRISLHPLLDGLMVRSGGKAAVLLPGEASDPHYQVMQCKLKAGINPTEPCQIYRIKAHVIR